jgi:hypothetical protein
MMLLWSWIPGRLVICLKDGKDEKRREEWSEKNSGCGSDVLPGYKTCEVGLAVAEQSTTREIDATGGKSRGGKEFPDDIYGGTGEYREGMGGYP